MDFAISLSTDSRFSDQFVVPVPDPPGPAPDPVEIILAALKKKVNDLGCPECCSGFPLTFVKESAEFGGGGTIIGNGFKLERLTPINDHLSLAEGANGGVINIGDLALDGTVRVEAIEAKAALLIGSKEVMQDIDWLQAQLADLAESPRWQENSSSFAAIGFAEFPLVVLRTNDPLIT